MDQGQVGCGGSSNHNKRKRARDDSALDSLEAKISRADSVNSGDDSSELAQIRKDLDDRGVDHVDPDENPGVLDYSGIRSPEAKRIQDDLLGANEESDGPAIQGLESLIRSFEEEILVPVPALASASASASAPETPFSRGHQPELGYLFKASDDELGLPPTFPSGGEVGIRPDDLTVATGSGATCFGEMLGWEVGLPSYDSFELGLGGDSDSNSYNGSYNNDGDFVALGWLFDYSDCNSVPADISELERQPESMPAL